MQGKTVAQSEAVFTLIPMPDDMNFAGNLHGGAFFKYIDNAAALVAHRHAQTRVVTASVERMDFLTPVRPQETLILKASLHMTGRTSMEVGVRVEAEDPIAGAIRHAATCFLSLVALDGSGKPTPVPPLILSGDIERARYQKALERKQYRDRLRMRAKEA